MKWTSAAEEREQQEGRAEGRWLSLALQEQQLPTRVWGQQQSAAVEGVLRTLAAAQKQRAVEGRILPVPQQKA